MKLPPPLKHQGLETNAPANEVKQKMFTLSPEETTIFIKGLKSQIKPSLYQSRSIQSMGVIAKDSALWEIEALLNYDFDNASNPVPNSGDSLKFDITTTNNTIANSDIVNAYNYFSSQINLHLTTNPNEKVKLIDITATENNNTLHVYADVIYTANNAGQRTTSGCDPITIQGHWSGGSVGTYGWPCTSIPVGQRGPNLCNARLNCSPFACSNGSNPSYSNVVTVQIATNDGTSNPFYIDNPIDGTAPCNTKYLTASQLNANVTLAQSYAVSNRPSSPTGMITTNYTFYNMPGFPYAGNYSIMAGYWLLRITYAVPNCSSGQPS